MYAIKTRFRAASAGSAPPQIKRFLARISIPSQVTASQALGLLKETAEVPETEVENVGDSETVNTQAQNTHNQNLNSQNFTLLAL